MEEAIEGLEEKTVVPEDKDSIVKIQFVDEKGNVVAGGDYFVDKDGDGIFNHTEILEWVPEGYELKSFGDYLVELFKETPLQLTVVKSENPDQKPENPDQKPENPEQKPENSEQKPVSPKTGDPAMVGLFGVATALSAGIIAKMRKSFKRKK